MSCIYAIAALTGLTLAVTGDVAERWLTVSEMQTAFASRTLNGAYASGLEFTETYLSDGTINYSDARLQATGRWHISDQGFCTFYDGSAEMSGGCFLARKVSANCFEFYLRESQDSGPLPEGETRPYVAQGWYPEEPSTCEILGAMLQ
jgi:hypothetical protein